jgi:hypothetical protein
MPQAGKKPAASRPKGKKTAVKKSAKRSTKAAAKKPPKAAQRKGKKGRRRQSVTSGQSYFFWVFAVPKDKVQGQIVVASTTRGTPPVKSPIPGVKIVGLDCKIKVAKNELPPLQFIQSPAFDLEEDARAYLGDPAGEGPKLEVAADNYVLYQLTPDG